MTIMYSNTSEFKKRIESLVVYQERNGYNAGFWVSEANTERFWALFDEARRAFLAIYPDDYVGGTIPEWIAVLRENMAITKRKAEEMRVAYREDTEKLLQTLEWFVRYFGVEAD